MLLEHFVDVSTSNAAITISQQQRARIVKQLNLWKGRKGRFDKVATVAWVINRLDLMKELKPLYL